MLCLKLKTPLEVYSRRDKANLKDLLSPETPNEEQLLYYEKVLAHRTFQFALCLYKELRYHSGASDPSLTWNKVDAWLRKAIERYQSIKFEGGQPLFIDLIIKITISRSYANIHNNKLLTAEKLLEFA